MLSYVIHLAELCLNWFLMMNKQLQRKMISGTNFNWRMEMKQQNILDIIKNVVSSTTTK